MSLRYLLDTNIVSAPFKRHPPRGLLVRLDDDQGACAIGAPTWHELRFGCQLLPDSPRKRALADYIDDMVLARFPVLDYDRRAADWHAAERARLKRLNITPPHIDVQLAAIAASNGLTLVTHNRSDFESFHGLTIEDWLA